jgi:peptide chain release factor 1
MYQKYADRNNLSSGILSISETDLGGVNEALLMISGPDAFGRMKFESGVHCVKRVPVTESGGRIHTSTATVAVFPEGESQGRGRTSQQRRVCPTVARNLS